LLRSWHLSIIVVGAIGCSSDVIVAITSGAAIDAAVVDASNGDAPTIDGGLSPLTDCPPGTTAVTGDLLLTEAGSQSVLRISPAGVVSVELSAQEIEAVVGEAPDLHESGIATLLDGSFLFSDRLASYKLVRVPAIGPPEVIPLDPEARPKGIAVMAGAAFVADDVSESVLRVDLATGEVVTAFAPTDFPIAPDLEAAIVEHNDTLYIGSQKAAGTAGLYRVVAGTVELVAEGAPFDNMDGALVSGPNSLFVTDRTNGGDGYIVEVNASGAASLWLSQAELIAVTGAQQSRLLGGAAIDSAGRLYASDASVYAILRVEPNKVVSVWVDAAALQAATGIPPAMDGSMAFERSCQ
jgi:hypothetical protein